MNVILKYHTEMLGDFSESRERNYVQISNGIKIKQLSSWSGQKMLSHWL
jgi:hypothetical protein